MPNISIADQFTATKKTNVVYTDITRNFIVHPDNGQLIVINNELAIKNSIENLCNLNRYELFHQQQIGANIRSMLFENPSTELTMMMETSIRELIENYEPRAGLLKNGVVVTLSDDEEIYIVSITYSTINNSVPQIITVFLNRVR